jgi:hypothetical protein
MRLTVLGLALLCTALLVVPWGGAIGAEPLVLPHPQQMQVGDEQIALVTAGKPQASIVNESRGASAVFAARWLGDRVKALAGAELPVVGALPATGAVLYLHLPGSPEARRLATDNHLDLNQGTDPAQSYAVVTEPQAAGSRVHVIANTDIGLLYGAYTLAQLIQGHVGQCAVPVVSILDYPDAPVRGLVWLRGSEAYLHGYCQWAASWKLNAYMWQVAWDKPLSKSYGDVLGDSAIRGMDIIPTLSWFKSTDIRFSSPEYVNPQLQRVREALAAGARAFGFKFDDTPLRLNGDDQKVYGSLIEAQASLLKQAHDLTAAAQATLFVTPSMYWPPKAGVQGNTLAAQQAYLQGMGQLLPADVRTFTTSISSDWADEYVKVAGRKPVFWHNFFPNDITDDKLYFEPYPQLSHDLVPRSNGMFVLGGWQAEWWKVNYLTFACNTWNPEHPCTLREAFTALFPAEADQLTRYAVLMGGHDSPAPTVAGWPDNPVSALSTKAYLNLPPTDGNLRSLQERLDNAIEAGVIAGGIATRGNVAAKLAQELVLSAERMKLNYQMALTACQVRQMQQTGDRAGLASTETQAKLEAALAAPGRIEQIAKSMGWPTDVATDAALKPYFQDLQARVASGEGLAVRPPGLPAGAMWIEAEDAQQTNFVYGVQLASRRPEARGAYGTGYLNLNVGQAGGPAPDPAGGSHAWFARWSFQCPADGRYALWVLANSPPAGTVTWQWDDGPEESERRTDKAPAAPTYGHPVGITTWFGIGGSRASVPLSAGAHWLTLRVRADDPFKPWRANYFLDCLVLAPPSWRP